ncbi:hypothetical protein AAVH_29530, partial [Aphelenchoides avenae]
VFGERDAVDRLRKGGTGTIFVNEQAKTLLRDKPGTASWRTSSAIIAVALRHFIRIVRFDTAISII